MKRGHLPGVINAEVSFIQGQIRGKGPMCARKAAESAALTNEIKE
jgi:hypothetical protein